jgi:hypothetical protein
MALRLVAYYINQLRYSLSPKKLRTIFIEFEKYHINFNIRK